MDAGSLRKAHHNFLNLSITSRDTKNASKVKSLHSRHWYSGNLLEALAWFKPPFGEKLWGNSQFGARHGASLMIKGS